MNSTFTFFLTLPGIKQATVFADSIFKAAVRTGPVPKHVAFIMDGNRRYAKNNKLPLEAGHSTGARNLVSLLSACYSLGIEEVSVYAFSIENFNRSQEEVNTLFQLLRDRLRALPDNKDSLFDLSQIRIRLIGNRTMVPDDILKDLEEIEEKTKDYKRGILNICAPYTSRDEIHHSIQNIATSAKIKAEAKAKAQLITKVSSPKSKSKAIANGDSSPKSAKSAKSAKSIPEKESQKEHENDLEKKEAEADADNGLTEEITPKTISDEFYYGAETKRLDILIRTSGHYRLSDYLLWQSNENTAIYFVDALWPAFSTISLYGILFDWSFHQVLKLSDDKFKDDLGVAKYVDLASLESPPPLATVTKR